jgi:AhpD family alkylhydroperoxidase
VSEQCEPRSRAAGPRAIEEVTWGDCLVSPTRDRELERESRKEWGIAHNSVPYVSRCPWLARSVVEGNLRNRRLAHLDGDLHDLIFLAVSQDSSCRYCYTGQRAQLRILGFDEQKIQAIEQASYTAQFEPKERLAIDFARRFSRASPAPGSADLRELVEVGHSPDEAREVAVAAWGAVRANRLTTLIGLPLAPVEGAEFRLSTRLLRPILGRLFRSARGRGEPESLPDELDDAPFAYVIRALEGLPAGNMLHRTLAGAWDSDILPKRSKTLAFAVVARGLGSERLEAEAVRLADASGFAANDTAEVLAHLGSPKLDPLEAALVPFVRETIRYRPEDIQRRARKLREDLSEEEFLEVVGVVAMANGIARLSLLFSEDR